MAYTCAHLARSLPARGLLPSAPNLPPHGRTRRWHCCSCTQPATRVRATEFALRARDTARSDQRPANGSPGARGRRARWSSVPAEGGRDAHTARQVTAGWQPPATEVCSRLPPRRPSRHRARLQRRERAPSQRSVHGRFVPASERRGTTIEVLRGCEQACRSSMALGCGGEERGRACNEGARARTK